ncbi:MAG: SDR family oxidoreductase [Gemmatimonadaceae bacterium]
MSDASPFRDDIFAGQVAIVTGGGTGIGFGIAELLTRLGAHVVVASRKAANVEAAAERLREAGGKGAATARTVDVRDPERVKQLMHGVRSDLGRIDILVNNAAGNFYAPSETLSPNAWRSVVEIDLYGTFFCSQAVMPAMRDQGGGRIINISMTLHYRGWPQMAHATAAKGGVDALTRTLAVEWAGHGIRVNAIAPGPVPTEGVRRAFAAARPGTASVFGEGKPEGEEEALAEHARHAIPLGRWGSPRDIANAVAFLASTAGDWITGEILVVDGGSWLARGSSGV